MERQRSALKNSLSAIAKKGDYRHNNTKYWAFTWGTNVLSAETYVFIP